MQTARQQISFPVDTRLDQSIDQSAGAEPGTLAEIFNLRKSSSGFLAKRLGYPRVGSGIGLGTPTRLITHRDSVALVDDSKTLLAYGDGVNRFSLRDRTPQWALTRSTLVTETPSTATNPGCVSASGATIHIWVDQNVHDLRCVVIDETSGNVMRGPETIVAINSGVGETNFPLARVVTDGTKLWVFYQVTAASDGLRVIATTVSNILTGGSWPAATSLGIIDPLAPSFDITVTTNFAFAAYNFDNAGTKQLKVIRVDGTATVTHTYTFNVGCRAVSCNVTGSLVWVLYALTGGGGANTDVRVFDLTLALLATNGGPGATTGVVESTGVGFYDSDSVLLVVGGGASTGNPRGHISLYKADYAAGTITLTDGGLFIGCLPSSQPFRAGTGSDGSDCFIWVECLISSTDPYGHLALVALTHDGGVMYATGFALYKELFPHLHLQNGKMSLVPQYSGSGYVVPQKVYVSATDTNTYVWDGSIKLTADIPAAAKEYRFQAIRPFINAGLVPTEAHGLAIMAGGAQPYIYDGVRVTELGFAYPPQVTVDPVTINGAGGSIGAGTYQWAITYEFVDSSGKRHQSAPYFSGTHVCVANDSATIATSALRMTQKQDREYSDGSTRIVIWRTLSTDPVNFYRVRSSANDPTTAGGTVSITDTAADATISANEILYTIRGELTNECPPPLRHAVQFNGRVAGIDAEYPERIVFSKTLSEDRGIEFSSANQTFVKGIGDLTALAEMDGNLYAFSATGIAFAASGSGIDNTGQGSWPEAQILSRACGCIDPRALCVTQDGIIFVSRQGDAKGTLRVWLLPRGGGNPINIGSKARGYLTAAYPQLQGAVTTSLQVTSCVNWVDGGRVAITLTDENNKGYWTEYDYVNRGPDGLGVWSAGVVSSWEGVASGAAARGRHWLATGYSSNEVLRSSDTVFTDIGGVYVQWILQTHDIKLSAVPFSKLNEVTVSFSALGQNGGVRFELSDTGFTSVAASHDFAFDTVPAIDYKVVRQWQPPVRRSSKGLGYALRLMSLPPPGEGGNPDTVDVVPTGMSFDLLTLRGTHRPQASERA